MEIFSPIDHDGYSGLLRAMNGLQLEGSTANSQMRAEDTHFDLP